METSYLAAKTSGVGELITQRKLFVVPEHQRDFSWEEENVHLFFEDIVSALDTGAPDYFIGLIVLLGSPGDAWRILDGQQRLATVTVIYSAIRQWLIGRQDYLKDAEQIESEFIAVRQLGGGYGPRLTLNASNRDRFFQFVVERSPDEDIAKQLKQAPIRSSDYLLMNAIKICRERVTAFAGQVGEDIKIQATRLFSLANYLEYRVKVAVLDVLSEENAFIIFESLNARGNELSALDLVKNHIFGTAGEKNLADIRPLWEDMADRIREKNADDFLKVFWTSRFGRVQKPQLYPLIKRAFPDKEGALVLARALAIASDHYIALDDARHEIWSQYGPSCSERIETLSLLGNRQVRAPLIAAIEVFDEDKMQVLLDMLITLTVRYQIVGKKRTGALEIACARLATQIRDGNVRDRDKIWDAVRMIMPQDEDFYHDFLRFSERNSSRAVYFLSLLEITFRRDRGIHTGNLEDIAHHPTNVLVDFILPKRPDHEWRPVITADPAIVEELLYRLGNRCLIEKKLNEPLDKTISFESACKSSYAKSEFMLTKELCRKPERWIRNDIEKRQMIFAQLALSTWKLP